MRLGLLRGLMITLLAFMVSGSKVNVEDSVFDPLEALSPLEQSIWVDSVFQSLNFDQQLGQLFMVAAYSNKGDAHVNSIRQLVRDENLGGLIFFQGGPNRQARLTNLYQAEAKTPLFIAMDAEWGLGMRFDSIPDFPKAMTLGAIQNEDLIYRMGEEMARQFKEIGMHINFGPVVDVNSNPNNPVIGYRAFGENPEQVASKGIAYVKGLQENGVIANAKHFPGHGDTQVDSHYSLPVIKHSKERIETVDLYPYKALIQENLMSVMVAHLNIPSLDGGSGRPTSLSKPVVTDLLQKEMGFGGLIFTDALNMKGVADQFPPGVVDVEALIAGNDVLLYSMDVPRAKQEIKKAIDQGRISKEEVERRVKKILKAKYWAGLHKIRPINTYKLAERVYTPKTEALIEELYAEAITVASNKGNILPFKQLDLKNFASLTIGGGGETFQNYLNKYAGFEHFSVKKGAGSASNSDLVERLKKYDVVVVGMMGLNNRPKRKFGVSESDVALIEELQKNHKLITVLFGNAYSAQFFENAEQLILAYENNDFTQSLVPQILFGGRPARGILPVTVSENMVQGVGGFLNDMNRLAFAKPETVGLDSKKLEKIDEVAERMVRIQAAPGAHVLVAKDGKVVFERSYGRQEYKSSPEITSETVWDLASITKVLATTQAVMFLVSRGEIDMSKTLGDYLPELRDTNKSDLVLSDVMAHEAGLKAYIPHYAKTVKDGNWKRDYYQESSVPGFSRPVSNRMYGADFLRDSIWVWTVESELTPKPRGASKNRYRYSDLTMYFMQAVVEKVVNQPLDEFLDQNFYSPLGLTTMTFNPYNKIPFEQIAPTEDDVVFRKRLVRGYVHDPGAAMYGGVAGHAGLFGRGMDLAVMMQMMLNKGYYGDVYLLRPGVVSTFTKRQSTQSRRGWGWDKPEQEKDNGGSAGDLAPKSSFGHTGFTGTCAWADPENDLIYIFLSNRVYPDPNNKRLLREGIRTEIHDLIYEAME